jgi:SHAQKYF class myb-like DNA-binding protein
MCNLFAEAVPKKILGIMKVKHLTREQVASHLQVIFQWLIAR